MGNKENLEGTEMMNTETATQIAAPKKQGNIILRAFNGAKKIVIQVRHSKTGRLVFRVFEGGALVYAAKKYGDHRFKQGVASVTPTTVYITEGSTEQDPEPEVEESTDMTEEVDDEMVKEEEI